MQESFDGVVDAAKQSLDEAQAILTAQNERMAALEKELREMKLAEKTGAENARSFGGSKKTGGGDRSESQKHSAAYSDQRAPKKGPAADAPVWGCAGRVRLLRWRRGSRQLAIGER